MISNQNLSFACVISVYCLDLSLEFKRGKNVIILGETGKQLDVTLFVFLSFFFLLFIFSFGLTATCHCSVIQNVSFVL